MLEAFVGRYLYRLALYFLHVTIDGLTFPLLPAYARVRLAFLGGLVPRRLRGVLWRLSGEVEIGDGTRDEPNGRRHSCRGPGEASTSGSTVER